MKKSKRRVHNDIRIIKREVKDIVRKEDANVVKNRFVIGKRQMAAGDDTVTCDGDHRERNTDLAYS